MMRVAMILAVALAEMRSVRRLIRYWIFSGLAVGISLLIFLYYSAIHGFASRFSATIGAAGPRFLMTAVGVYLLLILLLGLIFLAFDVRARDERERMAEVLDSRPFSNLELVVGRFVGLVVMAWAPVVFLAVGLQTFGGIARFFGWWMIEPIEPHSLLGFVFFDALASFILWCAVVVLLAVVLRNRLLVAVVALVLLGLEAWALFNMPLYFLAAVGMVSTFGSDIVPITLTSTSAVQRLAMCLVAAGLLGVAAALHPRPGRGRLLRRLLPGVALSVAGGLFLGGLVLQAIGGVERQERWKMAHESREDEPRATLTALRGDVRIDPGRLLEMDLELGLRAPDGQRLDVLLLTLNPGIEVDQLSWRGADVSWEQGDGLLEIGLAQELPAGESGQLEIRASGLPDVSFGYLDSARELSRDDAFNGQLALLGTDPGVFTAAYVALMPGNRWLPHPGTDGPQANPSRRPTDYFDLDLTVQVPSDWLVAGPGRRESVDGGDEGEARFRFHPTAVVPEVGLFASRFERRATEVAGIELEILVHRKHDRNLDFFADVREGLEARLAEIFADAAKLGLPYPYQALSLVETPSRLRGYGGGWRMDTVQSLPGVLMLRENGFPTSRFEFEFRRPERFGDREGGIALAKLEALERFFENDFSGGNLFLGGARNFLLFQTSARGEGALALDFVCHELVNMLLTGKEGYFSAFLFDSASGFVVGETITELFQGGGGSVAAALMSAAADRPSVWDRALGESLAALDPEDDPKVSLNVLALKGRAVARAILDGLGREKAAALLARLRQKHVGTTFDAEDLMAAAADIDADLSGLLGDWLHEAELAGFVVSPVEVSRLADDGEGGSRYQTRLFVRNDEATPGLLRLRYADWLAVKRGGDGILWQESEPVRVDGGQSVEIGLLSSSPLWELWLQPYLSLNRQEMTLPLPNVDSEQRLTTEPFLGSRPSDWAPARSDGIVIDDLDPGFSVEADSTQTGLRLSGGLGSVFRPDADLDQGLPEYRAYGSAPREWSRREIPSSWGKYRRTVALVRGGSGARRAIFAADLPKAGRWRLEYHLPGMSQKKFSRRGPGVRINARVGLGGSQGTYDLKLSADGEDRQIEFDASIAEEGWNALGDFDLNAGEVRVAVSDQTSGRLVIADAVRWQPATSAEKGWTAKSLKKGKGGDPAWAEEKKAAREN